MQKNYKLNFIFFTKYFIVGFINTALSFLLLWNLLGNKDISYSIAMVYVYLFGLIFQYLANKFFTFNSMKFNFYELLRYICLILINYFLSVFILTISLDFFKVSIFVASSISALTVVLSSFFLSLIWVYKK